MILRFSFDDSPRAVAEYLSGDTVELAPLSSETDAQFYARVVYFAHCEANERGDVVSVRGDTPGE